MRRLRVVIYGRGDSSNWVPPFRCKVIRLKRDPGPCDYRAGRSQIFQRQEPFLHFNDPKKWVDYYREYSHRKPSTGLCAVFMAVDLGASEIHLAGFDALLSGSELAGHDTKAELAALKALAVPVYDVRTNEPVSGLRSIKRGPRGHGQDLRR